MNFETYVEDQPIDHFRLVCSSAHCTATKLDINGKKHLVHKTICLEPYIFQGPVQYFMNPEFAECSIMDEDGLCKKCGCKYTKHMVIRHETVEKKKSTDKEIEKEDQIEDFYADEEEKPIVMSPNGDATIDVFNFNEPPKESEKKPKSPRRSNSKKTPKKEEPVKIIEVPVLDKTPKSPTTDTPKIIEVPVLDKTPKSSITDTPEEPKEEEPVKLAEMPKRSTRSKTTEIKADQLSIKLDQKSSNQRPRTTDIKLNELLKKPKELIVESKPVVRPKTTSVAINDLPKKSKDEESTKVARPKTTEITLNQLPEKLEKPNEEQPKRRSIKFKTTGVDSNDLPKKRVDQQSHTTKFKTTGVEANQLPKKFEKPVEEQPKRRSIKFKLPFKESSPKKQTPKTQGFNNNFSDEFDEISEVLQTKVEDYAPSNKLLRFSDVIHIVDKDEHEASPENSQINDEASTVYANVDRNSVNMDFDKVSLDRGRKMNTSARKIGQVLDRPPKVFASKIDKPSAKAVSRPTKAAIIRFGQNDEPTIASSTMTRNSNKKLKSNGLVANGKQNGYPKMAKNEEEYENEDFHNELACEEDDECTNLIDVDADTRSEKCRRWLIDNSIAQPPKRPEKFLQRLKRLVVNTGTQFKQLTNRIRAN